ncbi:MAG TPA: undecaprenyldiphospho-muramoylpentapeptide beta-N-acetylglucosaminyltransferase [Candidatus Eisenbacteria bacterium]|nr:undecaprenyldiphospho-muramoylpentapeptide beta-N-acetylglucosaminyltransferase [Candidatus Eisenbacteria bacterium]
MTGPVRPGIVIAGGGTGGHLFPGIALAEALRARGRTVTFVGTQAGIEVRAVPAAGFPLRLVPGAQVRGGGVVRGLRGLAATARGVAAARGLLGELRPSVVVGVGGYASVAMVVAARLRRTPVVLLEQNTIPGVASRALGRLAQRVCLGFAEAASFFPAGRWTHTGNPVRQRVLDAPAVPGSAPGLLVFGGSQGAHRLNEAAVDAIGRLGGRVPGLRIHHQTGTADCEAVVAGYRRLGIAAKVEPFVDDMGAAYAAADLVVARAGAMSCAEITARGLPSILVPYPYAADDHQRHNAAVLVRAGAAEMILDAELDGERLANVLGRLLGDTAARATMAAAARAAGRPDAALRVADVCASVESPASP